MKSPRTPGRWWAAGAALVGVTAVAVPVATVFAEGNDTDKDDSNCTVEVLPGPDGEPVAGSARAVSDDGQYIAGEVDGTAALWHDGEYIEIGDDYRVADVNSNGEVAAVLDEGDDDTSPGVWREGEFDTLEAADAESEIELAGINDAGDIIGNTNHGQMDETTQPLRWESGEVEAEELEITEMDHAVARDVSEEGDIIGHQFTKGDLVDEYVSWVWNSDGSDSELHSEATHGLGMTLEHAVMASSEDDSVMVWNHLEDGEVRQTDFKRLNVAGIFDGGTVYGAMEYGDEIVAATQADGDPTILPTPDGTGDSTTTDASENGDVLVGDGEDYPLVWHCE